MIRRRSVPVLGLGLFVFVLMTDCGRLPGKPKEAERWKPPAEIVDFGQLFSQRCSGCHGKDGKLGPARPLNDPLYQALVNEDILRQVISKGVPGTSMPAFLVDAGGSLTGKQIDVLVKGMKSSWGKPRIYEGTVLPPYSQQAAMLSGSGVGDPQRGAEVARTYCAHCHGEDGNGGPKAGSIIDPNYLALVSDQSLRVTVIVGRSDLGIPDWRENVPGKPMSAREITDVVAWLASHRMHQNQLFSSGAETVSAR